MHGLNNEDIQNLLPLPRKNLSWKIKGSWNKLGLEQELVAKSVLWKEVHTTRTKEHLKETQVHSKLHLEGTGAEECGVHAFLS
jgi:hypothetical protein